MADGAAISDHKAWLGYLQPDGLVVSPAALVDAQVILDRNAFDLHQQFLEYVVVSDLGDEEADVIPDIPYFFSGFLGWPSECTLGWNASPMPEELTVALPDIDEVLEPDCVLIDDRESDATPILLVQEIMPEVGLDTVTTGSQAGWSASASQRFERLLRETKVPIGVLTNGRDIRLIYAPYGESSGSLTFPVTYMREVAGRPVVAALHALLSRYRLLAAPKDARLPALLTKSRDYQSQVSTALAGQVLEGLYELLRGFQAANDRTQGELLRADLETDPNRIYAGLLTVLMRLVFLLYAEDRGLMPGSSLYVRNYSVHGLFERLRVDADRYPDTMDQRYGGWAQLVALFRTVHGGCIHPEMSMPGREGHLFDPGRYPFLDGQNLSDTRLPLLSDGCLERVLRNLLLLDGERLSYRTLDVEEIGSVYQTIMGFELQVVEGTSIGIAGKRKHKSEVPAPVVINLDELLHVGANDRGKWLKERTGHDWDNQTGQEVKTAGSVDELLVGLERRIARHATPHPVPTGGLVLQPTDERRRTGSHYTPRKLTGPIVRKTLEPVLAQLGENPKPVQILDLKVCDPAMGSGAFLVEACRQLADVLVDAWRRHGETPQIPPDEDELLLARRLVAQRCLYGVDKNPMAVDLAKLSLWLATLAKDHPFTFVDHSLRSGDSLVGLSRAQIVGFTWGSPDNLALGQEEIDRRIKQAAAARLEILEGEEWMTPATKRQKLMLADDALNRVRFYGDLVVAAFFGGSNPKERNVLRTSYVDDVVELLKDNAEPLVRLTEAQSSLKGSDQPLSPFHWEIEFPEVFGRKTKGFDAVVGNPPFLGGSRISEVSGMGYFSWLTGAYVDCRHHCDLVAYFFRRSYQLLRKGGCFGLVATNTLSQGDTRVGGLLFMIRDGAAIYAAQRRFPWPGQAAVVVSIVHVQKDRSETLAILDGKPVSRISAYLQAGENDTAPVVMENNPYFSLGSKIYGQGFLFADGDSACTPIDVRLRILVDHPDWQRRVPEYMGGDEVNSDPLHRPQRYVICLSDLREEVELRSFPDLESIVRQKVKPERMRLGDNPNNIPLKRKWWAFQAHRPELYAALGTVDKAMICSQVTTHLCWAIVPSSIVFSHKLCVLPLCDLALFGVLQSRIHDLWARRESSTLGDALNYSPSDCFETFPLPPNWQTNAGLEHAGREYYDFRAALMVKNDEGLTKTYNRFHSPEESDPAILKLREIHTHMDGAVLDAYGWSDVSTDCDFFLEYEDEGDEDDGRARSRKKPWRYRWPDEVRDEVLARLLDLNANRAEDERLAGLAAARSGNYSKPAAKSRVKRPVGVESFPGLEV